MNQATASRRVGRPSVEEAERLRQDLIATALDEFARAGFHGASLRDIARKANVSSRTLYNYYPDKLALFEACLEFSGSAIQPVLPDLDLGLQEGLVRYAIDMQHQLFATQAMRIATLIYREGSGFDELRQIAHIQFERHQVTPVARILATHGIPPDQCRSLATQFVSMAFGEWQRRLLFGNKDITENEIVAHAELVTDIFVSGILKRCAQPIDTVKAR